jgi:hypothetical protein
MCGIVAVCGPEAMCCPLGVELISNGFCAGDERLGEVLCFLEKEELKCLADFVGPLHVVGRSVFAR